MEADSRNEYQIIGRPKHPMDDRVLAQEALKSQEVRK